MNKYLPFIILPIIAACSLIDGVIDPNTFTGKYKIENGHGTFYPDDRNEKWYVETGINNTRSTNADEKNLCYKNVKFEGQLSGEENFSDPEYTRSFTITTIIKQTRVDCRQFNN